MIPDLISRILAGQYPLEIYGDGKQSRSFTYVSDIARAILLSISSPSAINTDFNLGYPQEITITDLASMLWDICDRQEPFRFVCLEPFPNDIVRRALDITKARERLGWEPKIDLAAGLAEVVKWFRSWWPEVSWSRSPSEEENDDPK